MSHYQKQIEQQAVDFPPVSVTDKTMSDIYREIGVLNAEIAGHIAEVKNNPKLAEFVSGFEGFSMFSLPGMLQEVPELLPELKPIFTAIEKTIKVGKLQYELTGMMVDKLEC